MEVIIEIDGVRHKQVADEPCKAAEYCEPETCSLFALCRQSTGSPCCINDLNGAFFIHYEKEPEEAPDEDIYYR